MKEKFTVSEMAQFACVTVDALKYYDREDLYKPAVVDKNTSYRYYTLEQYADIVLIRDLRNIGMSVTEIKDFLQNRSVSNSTEMLMKRKREISEEIDALEWKLKSLSNILDRIRRYDFCFFDALDIQTKIFSDRLAVSFNENIRNDVDLKMGFIHLENSLYAHSSSTIDAVYGALVEIDNSDLENNHEGTQLFTLLSPGYEEYFGDEDIIIIPKGKYACTYFEGNFWKHKRYMENLVQKILNAGMEPEGTAIVICGLDNLAFRESRDYIYEIQIKIR